MKEWIYGRNAVYETLRARRRHFFQLILAENAQEKGQLASILHMASEHNIPTRRVPRGQLERIASNHQGVALESSGYPYRDLTEMFSLASDRSEKIFILLLDALQDPQNLGTLFRTAEAVGVHGIVIPLARTAQVTPAVVNASSGASEHLIIAQANLHQAIEDIKEAGAWIIGLESNEEALAPEQIKWDGAIGLVVGSEGSGMRQLVRQSCDFLMRLPMRGKVESLNAAVAGSIALYLAFLSRSH